MEPLCGTRGWWPGGRIQTLQKGVQRGLAIRTARGYRTISGEAATTVVAGSLPWDLAADMYAQAYEKIARSRDPAAAMAWTQKDEEVRRLHLRRRQIEICKGRLSSASTRAGTQVAGAIRPMGVDEEAAIRPPHFQTGAGAHWARVL